MKKAITLFVMFIFLIGAAGCSEQTTNIVLDFSAVDVENIELYYYEDVPVNAKMQTITEQEDITSILNTLTSIKVKKGSYEPTAGGSVISFRFNLSDETSFEIIHNNYRVKKGQIMSSYNFDYRTEADICGLWDDFSAYDISDASESELPHYEK